MLPQLVFRASLLGIVVALTACSNSDHDTIEVGQADTIGVVISGGLPFPCETAGAKSAGGSTTYTVDLATRSLDVATVDACPTNATTGTHTQHIAFDVARRDAILAAANAIVLEPPSVCIADLPNETMSIVRADGSGATYAVKDCHEQGVGMRFENFEDLLGAILDVIPSP